MKRIAVIISDGHGEDTVGKWSPPFLDKTKVGDRTFLAGERFRENSYNDPASNMLESILTKMQIPVRQIAPEHADIPLPERRRRQHALHAELEALGFLPVTISIHANGHGNGSVWTTAQGIETFFQGSNEQSRILARLIQTNMMSFRSRETPYTMQTDRGIKTANLYVLREYKGIVVLPENDFMTNRQALELLCTENYIRESAQAMADAVLTFQGFSHLPDVRQKTEHTV